MSDATLRRLSIAGSFLFVLGMLSIILGQSQENARINRQAEANGRQALAELRSRDTTIETLREDTQAMRAQVEALGRIPAISADQLEHDATPPPVVAVSGATRHAPATTRPIARPTSTTSTTTPNRPPSTTTTTAPSCVVGSGGTCVRNPLG